MRSENVFEPTVSICDEGEICVSVLCMRDFNWLFHAMNRSY